MLQKPTGNTLPYQYHTLLTLTIIKRMSQWPHPEGKDAAMGKRTSLRSLWLDTAGQREPQNWLFFKAALPRPGFKGLPRSTCLGYSAQFLKYQLSSFLRSKQMADNIFCIFKALQCRHIFLEWTNQNPPPYTCHTTHQTTITITITITLIIIITIPIRISITTTITITI